MRVVRELDLDGRKVVVKELTVAEIRAWLKEIEAGLQGGDVVGGALFEDITFGDLMRFTSLSGAEIDALCPSQLRQVIDVAKEINSDFFLLRGRMVVIGQVLASGNAA